MMANNRYFYSRSSDSINIVRNRQGLREIAAKYGSEHHSRCFGFFYSKKQVDYRFSFIAKASLDLETGEYQGKPKRYLSIGANSLYHTAKRMLVLADKRKRRNKH